MFLAPCAAGQMFFTLTSVFVILAGSTLGLPVAMSISLAQFTDGSNLEALRSLPLRRSSK